MIEVERGEIVRRQLLRGRAPPGPPAPPRGAGGGGRIARHYRRRRGRRLYTATLGLVVGRDVFLVFHASFASDPRVMRVRLGRHLGEFGAAMCRIVPGFDGEDPIAREIVAPGLARLLDEVGADPAGARARRFYVHHVQRLGASS